MSIEQRIHAFGAMRKTTNDIDLSLYANQSDRGLGDALLHYAHNKNYDITRSAAHRFGAVDFLSRTLFINEDTFSQSPALLRTDTIAHEVGHLASFDLLPQITKRNPMGFFEQIAQLISYWLLERTGLDIFAASASYILYWRPRDNTIFWPNVERYAKYTFKHVVNDLERNGYVCV